MKELVIHPFLISLEKIAEQTESNSDALFKDIYVLQQDFKQYLYTRCAAEASIVKRFYYLKMVDYQLTRIRQMFASFLTPASYIYHQWMNLIIDTRRYISTGFDILNFQISCPERLMEHVAESKPVYQWIGDHIKFSETIVGLYLANLTCLIDGTIPSFAHFAKTIGNIFGLQYDNSRDDMRKVFKRSDKTPFLKAMISAIGNSKKVEKIID